MKLLPSPKIYIASSKIKNAGRGVFAGIAIKKDEIIEQCPVISLSEYDTTAITEGTFISYLFYFGKHKQRSVVALGFGSLYNHMSSPNAIYKENKKEQLLKIIALKNIAKDEEITVNYSGQEKKKTQLWFEP